MILDSEKLSDILELFYYRHTGYAVSCQEGNCEAFALDIGKYLIAKGVTDFEYVDYVGYDENNESVHIHSYIKYDGLIFDSFRFGEKSTEAMDNFDTDDYDYTTHEHTKNTIKINKDNPEMIKDLEKIEKELSILGFQFLKIAYSIENNYGLIRTGETTELNTETDRLDYLDDLTKEQKNYISKNNLIHKYNEFIKEYNKCMNIKTSSQDLLPANFLNSDDYSSSMEM